MDKWEISQEVSEEQTASWVCTVAQDSVFKVTDVLMCGELLAATLSRKGREISNYHGHVQGPGSTED